MLPLNQLTASQRRIYFDTICGVYGSYDLKFAVQILNNRHAVISTVRNVLLDGQVDAEAVSMSNGEVAVSRTAHLQFLDPGHSLAFDSSSPIDGALYLDRMIRIIASVRCSFGWTDITLFTGPVTYVTRDGDTVDVTAAGKETFGLRSAWFPRTYKKGRKTTVARALLTRTGEQAKYMQLPASRSKITAPVVIGRETKLWVKSFGMFSSMGKHLFYDARGIVRTATTSTKPVISFRNGNGGLLLSEPQVSFSVEALKNAIIVHGGNPVGPKRHVSALVVAPRSSPLSPWKIGLDPATGRGGFLTFREDNTHLRTKRKAIARGQVLLRRYLIMATEATWTSLPVWHLEPWDVAGLATSRFSGTVRVNKFSLPLRTEGAVPMTCGYKKNLIKPRRVIRAVK